MATTLNTTRTTIRKRNVKSIPENLGAIDFPPEIRLSPRDSKLFLAALTTPPKPNQKLKKAVARFKKMTENNR